MGACIYVDIVCAGLNSWSVENTVPSMMILYNSNPAPFNETDTFDGALATGVLKRE